MRKNRKELAWIAAAFLLLCLISLYRQISMRYFPDDPVRPVAVYLVYLLLLSGWWGAIRNRVTQRNMRVFLLAEHAVMLIGITIRFLQDALIYHDPYLMRISGYSSAVPIILFPLFGIYASFGLGKTEEHRINRCWYWLVLPAGVLTLLMLTNESHHLVFHPLEDAAQSNLFFHPNVGLYAIVIWAASLFLARVILIYHRSRELEGYPYLRIAPSLIAVLMLVVNIPYLSSSYVVNYELIEYTVLLYFLEIMVWESCVIVGMVPINTHYEEVFDRSTIAMQIVDERGNPFLKSACAPELSVEMFDMLRQRTTVRTSEGQELHLHLICGGYSIWQNDVSQTIAVIDELQKSAEKLEYEGELLRQELKIKSDEAAVKEQNRIYNQLTDEIGEQLSLLNSLLAKREWVADKDQLFRKICLIGTYVKRRCNLRLVEQSDGKVPDKDLELCYHELAGCLEQMGVVAEVCRNTRETLAPEFAIFTLDVFEFILEYERFELHCIKVAFEADNIFSVQVYSDSGSSGHNPAMELQRINRENYDISLQAFEGGYQVLVRGQGLGDTI